MGSVRRKAVTEYEYIPICQEHYDFLRLKPRAARNLFIESWRAEIANTMSNIETMKGHHATTKTDPETG